MDSRWQRSSEAWPQAVCSQYRAERRDSMGKPEAAGVPGQDRGVKGKVNCSSLYRVPFVPDTPRGFCDYAGR